MIRTIFNAFLILTDNHLNSDLAKEASCFLHTRIIAHLGEKVNCQNASKSACPATSDQLGGIAADLNGNALDSVCHAVHLLREGMKKAAPKDCSVCIQLMR